MKFAISQIEIKWEDKLWNISKAEKLIEFAFQNHANIIVFPEMSFTGFSMNTIKTQDLYEETLITMQKFAKKYSIFIGFGWVKKCVNFVENHYTVVNSFGNMVSDYVKIHSFSFDKEDKFFHSGKEIRLFKLNNTWISTFICYDLRFPEIFQIASDKANIIIVAANWPSERAEHWRCLLRARAVENQCYIIGVNCFGQQKETYYSGNSSIINPVGDILYEVANKEELIIFDINDDVADYRKQFPLKRDRRVKLYTELMQ